MTPPATAAPAVRPARPPISAPLPPPINAPPNTRSCRGLPAHPASIKAIMITTSAWRMGSSLRIDNVSDANRFLRGQTLPYRNKVIASGAEADEYHAREHRPP